MPYRSHVDYRKLVEEKGKRCPACTKHKQADDFSVARDRHDGRAGYCKACVKDRYAETKRRYERSDARKLTRARYYRRHPKAAAEQSRRYRALKRFRDTTAVMDRMYPSHFRREDS